MKYLTCCVILSVTVTTMSAFTVVKELTCDFTTPNGCDGYKQTNIKLESDAISPVVGQKALLMSKSKFTKDDATKLCVELNFDAYSKPGDDLIELLAGFPGTSKAYPLYPPAGEEGKTGYGGKFSGQKVF